MEWIVTYELENFEEGGDSIKIVEFIFGKYDNNQPRKWSIQVDYYLKDEEIDILVQKRLEQLQNVDLDTCDLYVDWLKNMDK